MIICASSFEKFQLVCGYDRNNLHMSLGRHLHSEFSFPAHWFLTLAAEQGHQEAAERAHLGVPMPEMLMMSVQSSRAQQIPWHPVGPSALLPVQSKLESSGSETVATIRIWLMDDT